MPAASSDGAYGTPPRGCGGRQAPRGAPSTGGTEEGALGDARDREGAAALLAHVPPAARAEGGERPGLTGGGYPEAPEPGRHVHKVVARCACVPVPGVSPPESWLWGSPRGFRSSLPESPRRRGQPPRKPESTVRPQRGGRLKAATSGCLPKCRARGNATRNAPVPRSGSGLRHPSLGGTADGSPASRPAAKFRAAGCTAEVGRGDPAVPAAGEAGDGTGGRPGGGSAPLAAQSGRSAGGLFPCLRGCASPGSVKCQDAHPFRNLPRGAASSASPAGGQTGKKLKEMKLLVALQNWVHRVSGQELPLAFTIHSPQYRGSRDLSGRAGAARRTCQSNPLQPREHRLNRGSPCLSESRRF